MELIKGVAAYEAEDYSTALSHLAPLAENGDANAKRLNGMMFFLGMRSPLTQITAFMA